MDEDDGRFLIAGAVSCVAITFSLLATEYYKRNCCSCALPMRASCIADLKSIDGAKAVWALEQHKTPTDVPIDSDLFGYNSYIREKPVCLDGGKHILGSVGQKPHCSIPDHTF